LEWKPSGFAMLTSKDSFLSFVYQVLAGILVMEWVVAEMIALYAVASAFSFPGIPTLDETHTYLVQNYHNKRKTTIVNIQ